MNARLKETKDVIDSASEAVISSMKMIQLFGGSEDLALDILEGTLEKHYESSDDASKETMLIMILEMGIAWNNAVDELGDSTFHKDALSKRFLKYIWEE